MTPSAGPDTALIALCAEHIANWRAFNSGAEPEGAGPLAAAYNRTYDAVSDAEPQTLDGLIAKARATKLEASNPDGTESPHDVQNWSFDLVCDLLRIAGGAA